MVKYVRLTLLLRDYTRQNRCEVAVPRAEGRVEEDARLPTTVQRSGRGSDQESKRLSRLGGGHCPAQQDRQRCAEDDDHHAEVETELQPRRRRYQAQKHARVGAGPHRHQHQFANQDPGIERLVLYLILSSRDCLLCARAKPASLTMTLSCRGSRLPRPVWALIRRKCRARTRARSTHPRPPARAARCPCCPGATSARP